MSGPHDLAVSSGPPGSKYCHGVRNARNLGGVMPVKDKGKREQVDSESLQAGTDRR